MRCFETLGWVRRQVRRLSDVVRSCTGRGEEWRSTDDGEPFSVGVECAVLRDDGLWVSHEQSSNAGPDLRVNESTGLATKNTLESVRGGSVGHQAGSRDWLNGLR